MFLYRLENLEVLKARGGFLNDFTNINYLPTYKGDKSVPRLYFFKNDKEQLAAASQKSIEAYLESIIYKNDIYPVRFKELLNYKENFDEEWSSPEIAYYYEFSKDEPKKLIVSIEDIEYWDKEVGQWKKL